MYVFRVPVRNFVKAVLSARMSRLVKQVVDVGNQSAPSLGAFCNAMGEDAASILSNLHHELLLEIAAVYADPQAIMAHRLVMLVEITNSFVSSHRHYRQYYIGAAAKWETDHKLCTAVLYSNSFITLQCMRSSN